MENVPLTILNTSLIILNWLCWLGWLNWLNWLGWLKDWLSANILILTALISLLVWGLTEWAKRSYDMYLRKVERYTELIKLIEGLKEKETPFDSNNKIKFIEQLSRCWLVCSDDIIEKIIKYVKAFNDHNVANKDKDKIKSDLMVALRKDALKIMPWDVWRKTNLTYKNYNALLPTIHGVLNITFDPTTCKSEAIASPADKNTNVPSCQSQEEAKREEIGGSSGNKGERNG